MSSRLHGWQEARVVFLSSGGAIYGDIDGADESATPAPKSYYAIHKYVAERYLELSGLSHAIARLANAYGPGQRADQEGGVVAIFSQALRSGQSITIHGSGDQRRDFVHVNDITDAVCLLAASRVSGTWNVGSGTSVSIRDLLAALESAAGCTVPVAYASRRDGDVEVSRRIIDRIRRDLGWAPRVDLRDGLQMLVAAKEAVRPSGP